MSPYGLQGIRYLPFIQVRSLSENISVNGEMTP
jgi:hypothetical protein